MSPMIRSLLIYVVCTEALILGVSTVVVVIHGIWLQTYRKWSSHLLDRAHAIVAGALDDLREPHPNSGEKRQDPRLLLTLPPHLLTKLFGYIDRTLTGNERACLTRLGLETGLSDLAERYCHSRLWWRRLEGARLLTLIRTGDQVVPGLLEDPHPWVRAQAAEWAGVHPTAEVIEKLLTLLADPSGLCRFTVQDSLIRIGPPAIDPLLEFLNTHSGAVLEPALEVALSLAEQRFSEPALKLCTDVSPRVRALAASLLGALGGSESVEVLTSLLEDPVPEVRAAAAGSLGKLHHWPAAKWLAGALRDHAWIVRREAGLALRAVGSPGILFLRRSLSDHDPFAADMAKQVLDLPDMSERVRV